MTALDELLGYLTSWERMPHAWQWLTGGDGYCQALTQAVQQRAVAQVKRAYYSFIQQFPPPRPEHGTIARALLTCAEIAVLDSQTAGHLPDLLSRLAPIKTSDGVQGAGAAQAIASHAGWMDDWCGWLRRWLWELNWLEGPSPTCAAWAWDAIGAFRGHPRPMERAQRLTALLTDETKNSEVFSSKLRLELLAINSDRLPIGKA